MLAQKCHNFRQELIVFGHFSAVDFDAWSDLVVVSEAGEPHDRVLFDCVNEGVVYEAEDRTQHVFGVAFELLDLKVFEDCAKDV